jgi:hypothetical protein
MKEEILKEAINQLKPKVFCGGNRCSGFHNIECDDSKHPDGRELVDIRKVIKVMSDFEQRIRKDEFKKTLKEHDKNLISEVKRAREETLKELIREYQDNELDGKGYDFYFSIRAKIDELNKLKK